MRHALIFVAVLAACTDEPPMDSGPDVTSHVASWDYPAKPAAKLDVLLVVDNTQAMASHQAQLHEIASAAGMKLSTVFGGFPDLRVGVTSDGGITSWVELSVGFDLVQNKNFDGSLADVLGRMVDNVGTSNSGANRPLATMQTGVSSPGFLRENAALGVATISATDDASNGAETDYAASLKAQKIDPAEVMVSGIYARPAPRLDAFHTQFPNRNSYTPLDAPDHADAFTLFGSLLRTTLEGYCVDELPLDVDAETPGNQFDCSVVADYNGLEHVMARCGSGASPCWDIVLDSQLCPSPGSAKFVMQGWTWAFHPRIRGQCVVK